MDPLELLHQLKHIQADPEFVKRSKSVILATVSHKRGLTSFASMMLSTLQTGSALALAGILLLLVLGGFSAGKLVTPFKLSSLNPESLRAEAEAVDIQIKLTDLSYSEAAPIAPSIRSFEKPAPARKDDPETKDAFDSRVIKEAEKLGIGVTSSSEGSTIDNALEKLTE